MCFLVLGIASAVGGLVGALLHSIFTSSVLTLIFGALLLFAGFTGFTEFALRMKLHGVVAWIAGALSGGFGGLVGNQGGIRSAALMTFDLPKKSLVATATAIGIIVDLARMPIYLASQAGPIWSSRAWIATASMGVVIGTFVGMRFLKKVSEPVFRRILGIFIFLLGVYMMLQGVQG